MPFRVFLDIKVQAPEVLYFRKDPFMEEPALQAPASDAFVLEDSIGGNADGFQERCLRLAPHTRFAELRQDSEGHVSC
jgi:hypothetical protein